MSVTIFLAFGLYANNATAQSPFSGSSCGITKESCAAKSIAIYGYKIQQFQSIFYGNVSDGHLFGEVILGNDTSNIVYGLYLCRGDMDTSTCRYCVSAASEYTSQNCPYSTSAVTFYDSCGLHYSNDNFF